MVRTTRELTDAQWLQIEGLFPSRHGLGGRQFRDHRQVIEGIVHRYRCGLPWRDLPAQFGPWQTVWKRHQRFTLDGTWERILARLLAEADAAGEIDWIVSVDSTINRVHQHGATAHREEVSSPRVHTGGTIELQESCC